jgi:hypothetical protein
MRCLLVPILALVSGHLPSMPAAEPAPGSATAAVNAPAELTATSLFAEIDRMIAMLDAGDVDRYVTTYVDHDPFLRKDPSWARERRAKTVAKITRNRQQLIDQLRGSRTQTPEWDAKRREATLPVPGTRASMMFRIIEGRWLPY